MDRLFGRTVGEMRVGPAIGYVVCCRGAYELRGRRRRRGRLTKHRVRAEDWEKKKRKKKKKKNDCIGEAGVFSPSRHMQGTGCAPRAGR